MKKIIILIVLLCFFTGCSSKKEEMVRVEMITTREVKEVIDNYENNKDIVIVDVRTESEYKSGHLKEAINIPVGEIESITISKDKTLIVYCRSGSRSASAAKILSGMGYKVLDMGGIMNWEYDVVVED